MKKDGTPEHIPDLIYWDEDNISIPGEVCEACSRHEDGYWVPVSFCPEAMEVLKAREARHEANAGTV